MCQITKYYWVSCKHITRETSLCDQAPGETPCGNTTQQNTRKPAHCIPCISNFHRISYKAAKGIQELTLETVEKIAIEQEFINVAFEQSTSISAEERRIGGPLSSEDRERITEASFREVANNGNRALKFHIQEAERVEQERAQELQNATPNILRQEREIALVNLSFKESEEVSEAEVASLWEAMWNRADELAGGRTRNSRAFDSLASAVLQVARVQLGPIDSLEKAQQIVTFHHTQEATREETFELRKLREDLRKFGVELIQFENHEGDCNICQQSLGGTPAPGERVEHKVQLKCGHNFGHICIIEWARSENRGAANCPLCRAQVIHLGR